MSRTQGGASFAEFSSREIASFWLLHAVNSGLSPLRHLGPQTRPSGRGLPGDGRARRLAVYVRHGLTSARDPHYDHDALGETFVALTSIFAGIWKRSSRRIAFDSAHPREKYLYHGEIVDERCLNRSRWILAVRAATEGRYYRQDAPARQSLLFGVRSRAGSPRAPWNAPDPHAHAASAYRPVDFNTSVSARGGPAGTTSGRPGAWEFTSPATCRKLN